MALRRTHSAKCHQPSAISHEPSAMARISVLQPDRPSDSTEHVRTEHRIAAPDVVAVAERRVEDSALAVGARPGLRVIAAFSDLGTEIADVGLLGVEAEEDVDGVALERERNVQPSHLADV